MAEGCDLLAVVDSNLVAQRSGWPQAAVCEECVRRQNDGAQCLGAPSAECCSSWEQSWHATCQFQCGSTGGEATHALLCPQTQAGFSVAAVALFGALLA